MKPFFIHRSSWFSWMAIVASFGPAATASAESVAIVVGQEPRPLEQKAAQELHERMPRIFPRAETRIHGNVPMDADVVILVGNPDANQAIRRLANGGAGFSWPKLSDQGHCLKSVKIGDRAALVVGGGSPLATLWAAYELELRWGVRFLLSGDVDPTPGDLPSLDGIDVVLEPSLETRTWHALGASPVSSVSWGLAEHRRVLAQLAKLKFNRVSLEPHSIGPFVDFEFQGVKKQSDSLWHANLPIDSETVGRAIFGNADLFTNPDFRGKTNHADRVAAGRKLIEGIMAQARELGMSTTLAVAPLGVPKEFAAILPDKSFPAEGDTLTPMSAVLQEYASAHVRAYVETYPDADALTLRVNEISAWRNQATESAARMTKRYGLPVPLESLFVHGPTTAGEKDNGPLNYLNTTMGSLELIAMLLADGKNFQRPQGGEVGKGIGSIDARLLPWMGSLLPPGAECVTSVFRDGRLAANHQKLMSALTANKVPGCLVLTLDEENASALPQYFGASLAARMEDLRSRQWGEFLAKAAISSDQDAGIYYLSRAAFDPRITPREAIQQLYGPIGGEAATERMLLAFEKLGAATELVDFNSFGLDSPTDFMTKHYQSGSEAPGSWGPLSKLYGEAMNEMYRANDAFTPTHRPVVYYFAKRLEFAVELLGCVTALRESGAAMKANDKELAAEKLASAVESMYNGLTAYASVAKNDSDRGAIALLNVWAYKPMQEELARLEESP